MTALSQLSRDNLNNRFNTKNVVPARVQPKNYNARVQSSRNPRAAPTFPGSTCSYYVDATDADGALVDECMFVVVTQRPYVEANTIRRHKEPWEISYLRAVYPQARPHSFRVSDFYRLECLYTALLPPEVREAFMVSPGVYTATLPGPSCGELPCPCDASGPAVSFARDPMLQNKWPPCNVSGVLCVGRGVPELLPGGKSAMDRKRHVGWQRSERGPTAA